MTMFRAFHVDGDKEKGGWAEIRQGGFTFTSDNVFGSKVAIEVPWRDVETLEVDGAEALQSRVTVTRLFATGVFAFALKKKTGDAFIYMLVPGKELLFRVPGRSSPELRGAFGPYRRQFGTGRAERKAKPLPPRPDGFIRCPQCARMSRPDLTCELCGASLRSVLPAETLAALDAPEPAPEASPGVQVPDGMKLCPMCAEEIKAAAIKCKHCGEMLTE